MMTRFVITFYTNDDYKDTDASNQGKKKLST